MIEGWQNATRKPWPPVVPLNGVNCFDVWPARSSSTAHWDLPRVSQHSLHLLWFDSTGGCILVKVAITLYVLRAYGGTLPTLVCASWDVVFWKTKLLKCLHATRHFSANSCHTAHTPHTTRHTHTQHGTRDTNMCTPIPRSQYTPETSQKSPAPRVVCRSKQGPASTAPAARPPPLARARTPRHGTARALALARPLARRRGHEGRS